MTKIAVMSVYGTNLQNLLQNGMACLIDTWVQLKVLSSKFVHMITPVWPFTFLDKIEFAPFSIYTSRNLKPSTLHFGSWVSN